MAQDPALGPDVAPETLSTTDWKALLAPMEYAILREAATERPGTGRYLHEEGRGTYHCAGCGSALYRGEAKFHSGCGWPSFFEPVSEEALRTVRDTSHGMIRTEMRCGSCDGHLGHIFQDAPQTPTGTRHCVNGYALVFVPEGEDVLTVFQHHRESRS